MRYYLTLVSLLAIVGVLFAQQIPFQGKLLENGTPITGQRTFVFNINSSNINWAETHSNVVVTNGLYALVLGQNTPLPNNLFSAQNSVPLSIQVNGQNLPRTTLYAPFESDPSVPENLKDGVSWNEVSGKPTLDESSTNEIQALQLSGTTLSLTNANSVELPATSNPTVPFRVGSSEDGPVCALEQLSHDGVVSIGSMWQSFSIRDNGHLQNIQVNFANVTSVNVRFKLYKGEGINTQPIYSRDYGAANFGATLSLKAFEVAANSAIQLTGGDTYTLYVEGLGDALTFRQHSNNPYIFGRMSVAATTDAIFKIIVNQAANYTFEVTTSGTTVNAPLIVNERIQDQTGYVMPVGTVVSYAGATPPKGWLLCNGTAVRRDVYPYLFEAIGSIWGSGDGIATFNLPDFRGRFLRGVDGAANVDPDKNSRTALYNGNTGNNVGSYQGDSAAMPNSRFRATTSTDGAHHHEDQFYRTQADRGGVTGPYLNSGVAGQREDLYTFRLGTAGSHSHTVTITGGDKETRPKNAYVNFIIKY